MQSKLCWPILRRFLRQLSILIVRIVPIVSRRIAPRDNSEGTYNRRLRLLTFDKFRHSNKNSNRHLKKLWFEKISLKFCEKILLFFHTLAFDLIFDDDFFEIFVAFAFKSVVGIRDDAMRIRNFIARMGLIANVNKFPVDAIISTRWSRIRCNIAGVANFAIILINFILILPGRTRQTSVIFSVFPKWTLH